LSFVLRALFFVDPSGFKAQSTKIKELFGLGGCIFHCFDDVLVSGATAQIPIKTMANVFT
jgi:hypothetical protein